MTSLDFDHELHQIGVMQTEGDVHRGLPGTQDYENVLFIPKIFGHMDSRAGIYDRVGRRINKINLLHGYPTTESMNYIRFVNGPVESVRYDGSVIYGGNLELHYGHFITECLSFLWYASTSKFDKRPIVFNSTLTAREILGVPWAKAFIDACEIDPSRILTCKFPTSFAHITIPDQGFCEHTYVYDGFIKFCEEMGDVLSRNEFDNSILYLSRRGVSSGSMRITNEWELIEGLKKRGVEIVDPVNLSVGEQVALFRNNNVAIGPVGSAFHTSIFSKNPKGIAFTPENFVSRSFFVFDSGHESSLDYYSVKNANTDVEIDKRFYINYEIEKLDLFVDEIVDLATKKRDISSNKDKYSNIYNDEKVFLVEILNENLDILCLNEDGFVIFQKKDVHISPDCRLYGLVSQKILVLFAPDQARNSISFLREGKNEAVWPFVVNKKDGSESVLLMHPESGAYLCAPPSELGHAADISSRNPGGWEHFTLAPVQDVELSSWVVMMNTIRRAAAKNIWIKSAFSSMM